MTHKEAHKQHTGPAKTFGCPFCLNIQNAERATRRDALRLAAVNLEVAVDDYAQAVYFFSNTDGIVAIAAERVVKASTAVAFAMHDADVNGASSAEIIPVELRAAACDDEIAALRHVRSERARKALASKPPKGAALSSIRAWDKRMQAAHR